MTMKDRDGFPVLFYVTDPDVETVTGLREATVRDHVAALIAEGGEIVEPMDLTEFPKGPGCYLVFLMREEKER